MASLQNALLRRGAAKTLFWMGQGFKSLGRNEVALACYDKSVRLAPELPRGHREAGRLRSLKFGTPELLRFVGLGTTGLCNASCIHCPTGKDATASSPRGMMPMAMFCRVIDEIATARIPITGHLAFGLFGDALVDPLVVARASYARAKLPYVRLLVNTNGAAYSDAQHAALEPLISEIALHCESLTPPIYDDLMRPLRAARVFPKLEAMLRTFGPKVSVSVPVSRRNQHELKEIERWFGDRGAGRVTFDPLSSRCAEDRTLFDQLSIAPARIRCPGTVLDDLVIDCDGRVLVCCQDFQRLEGVGELSRQSVPEVLGNKRREAVRKMLDNDQHDDMATCSRCYSDCR